MPPQKLLKTDVELLLERMHGLLKIVVDFQSPLDARFRQDKDRDLSDGKCDSYTVMIADHLDKSFHKDELVKLGDEVVALPKTMDDARKAEYCSKIASHYNRMLNLIKLVHAVYDTNAQGEFSLAGIVFKNINITNNVLEIFFCAVPQDSQGNPVAGAAAKERMYPYALDHALRGVFVDFKNLMGFKVLVDDVMTKDEAQIFLQELQYVLHQSAGPEFRRLVCNDTLLDRQTVFPGTTCDDVKGYLAKNEHTIDEFMLSVPSKNPVLDTRYCQVVHKVVVPFDAVKDQYTNMRINYHKNLLKIRDITENELLERPDDKNPMAWRLRNIHSKDLDALEHKVKSAVVTFFIQTIVSYHALLNQAMHTEHVLAS